MKGSESWPRKVELMCAHSKIKKRDYRDEDDEDEYVHT